MRTKLLILVVITALAASLRLYQLDRLPPGPNHDSVFYGLDALAIQAGARPVFVATNRGREALFSYLVALVFQFTGTGSFGIYLASALVGIVTIPAVYLVAREMLADATGLLHDWGPLVASLAMAGSYWHLQLSRQGMRVSFTPLATALTLYFLWRGLRTRSQYAFIACGLTLGVSLYTYQSSRLLVILVAVGLLGAAHTWPSLNRETLGRLTLILGLAALIALPLGVYAIQHPAEFNARAEQAFVLNTADTIQGKVQALTTQVIDALQMFSVKGDPQPLFNIPGRPALDPLIAVAFYVGLIIALLRFRQRPYGFLLLWLGVMIIPAMVAGLGVAEKRSSGALPVTAMLIAVGLLAPLDYARQLGARRLAPVGAALVLALLAGSTGWTYRDYFLVWGRDPELFTHFEAGQAAIGYFIRDEPAAERILMSPVPAEHVTVRMTSEERPGVQSYNGRVCLIAPRQTVQDTTYIIVPHDDPHSLPLLDRYFPDGEPGRAGPLHYGQPYFLTFHIPAGVAAQIRPEHLKTANWDNKIGLLGYDLDESAYKPGDTVELTLYYEGLDDMQMNYTAFTHLVGPPNAATGGPLWAQDDSEPCRRFAQTSSWTPDDVVRDTITFEIPKNAPAADYQLNLGFYEWQSLARLPLLDTALQAVADHLALTTIHVEHR